MYWYPYLDPKVFYSCSLVLPSLGRIEEVIITILWLASVGFIIHCLHPSITFQWCSQPDLLLDLWHGGPFPLEHLCWTSFPLYLCLGSKLLRLCWLNLKQIAIPSIQCIWKRNEYLMKKIPFMKSSVFEHTWM